MRSYAACAHLGPGRCGPWAGLHLAPSCPDHGLFPVLCCGSASFPCTTSARSTLQAHMIALYELPYMIALYEWTSPKGGHHPKPFI